MKRRDDETTDDIPARVTHVQHRIGEAARRAGRSPDDVTLMVVGKTFPFCDIARAVDAGVEYVGENRVQEAEDKYTNPDRSFQLHLIGHLQSNKARRVPGLFSCVQSVDSVRIARALDQAVASDESRVAEPIEIMLQLNVSHESTKFGFTDESELRRALDTILTLKHVRPTGLMAIGPFTDDERAIRAAFRAAFACFSTVRESRVSNQFCRLSIGMSDDFELAIEEGSTFVRIGSAILGRRAQ